MGKNSNDNFIFSPYFSGRSNNNNGNGPINPLGLNNQGGRFGGMPPDEYSVMPMYRMLNCNHPVEACTGQQLTDLQTSTILRFSYEYSDYVAVMRQAALPIHNCMSKNRKLSMN
jgi:hypothetical protein